MLKSISIDNVGTVGWNADLAPWQLAPEGITENSINFRVVDAGIEPHNGSTTYYPVDSGISNPAHLINVLSPLGNFYVVCGTNSIQALYQTTWLDISSGTYPGVNTGNKHKWSSCLIGKNLFINHPNHYPEYIVTDTSNIMTALPYAPGVTWQEADKSFEVLRSHKNFLFALNLTESGDENPDGYRWSHPAEEDGTPYTWSLIGDDAALGGEDESSLAGKAQLGADTGSIVDGLSMRDDFVIYSENAINILSLSGDEYVWRRREMTTFAGLINRNSLVQVGGVHYFLADGDILRNDGNSIESIAEQRVLTYMLDNISAYYISRSFVVKYDTMKEIWFCVPFGSSQDPNHALIYNWHSNTWSIRELPTGMQSATLGKSGNYSPDAESRPALSLMPISLHSDNTLRYLSPPIDSDTNLDTVIERTDFALEGHIQVTRITRVYPKIEALESGVQVFIQLGSQEYAGATPTWKDPVLFTPAMERKVDVRTTGKLHCWRIMSIDKGMFRFTGMDIEYHQAGKR